SAIIQMTVLDEDIVGDAPDDAVAVKVAHSHTPHGDAITLVQANRAIVERALVDHFIVSLVAIDRDVLDDDAGNARALNQREIRGDFRIPIEVETLLEAALEFEAIARRGNQGSLDD